MQAEEIPDKPPKSEQRKSSRWVVTQMWKNIRKNYLNHGYVILKSQVAVAVWEQKCNCPTFL